MSEHLPECNQRDTVWQKAYYSGVECVCPAIRACEQRVLQEQIEGRQHDMVMAYLRALDAVEAAVEAIPAPYRVRGDHSTYDSYHEGKSDMQDLVVAAIRALKENK